MRVPPWAPLQPSAAEAIAGHVQLCWASESAAAGKSVVQETGDTVPWPEGPWAEAESFQRVCSTEGAAL